MRVSPRVHRLATVPRLDTTTRYVRPAAVRLRDDPRPPLTLSPAQWRLALLGTAALVMLLAYLAWVPSAPLQERENSVRARASVGNAPATAATETPEQREAKRKLRRAAQDAAEPLGRLRDAAHALHPEYWDPAGIAAVDQLARSAEQAYLAQSYADAIRDYRLASERYAALTRNGQARRASAIASAQAALARGDADAAQTALTLAGRIRSGADVAALGRRLQVLPTVLAQLDRGIAAREIEDYEMARAALQEALRLDPATGRARGLLAEVEAARAKQRYMSVMDRGFDALGQAEYEAARAAFAAMTSYAPTATTAALRQVSEIALVEELGDVQTRARAHLDAERYSEAEADFRRALAKDAALADAQRGLAQARERREMQTRLDEALARPERFSDDTVLARARTTLADARALVGIGPGLRARIDRLDRLLAASVSEVNVTLRSDNATAIRVFRIGVLGRFAERSLTLRPGRYTVMGSRDGYRDVRVDVDVRPGMAPVEVRCVEPIR